MALCPPAAHLTVTPLPGGEDGGEGERWGARGARGGRLHQGETLPVGSRQFQAIAPCSLGFCLHTHTHTHISMQRQMTINGCDNVVCVLSLFSGGGGGGGCVVQPHVLFSAPDRSL